MRKRSLYSRLAIVNIKSNSRFYYPYILTCIITVAMFYIVLFLQTNEGIQNMRGSASLESFMQFGSYIIGIFAAIFLFYTNNFLMKRRKKELGLYNILGMEKRHIARILFWETVVTGITALGLGLCLGILMSKLVLLLLLNILQISIPFGFSVSTLGISATLLLFAAIFMLILLSNLIQIRLSKPIELLKGGEMGQKEPKTKVLLTIVGILSLGTGYAIAILVKSPMDAIAMFFIAVLLVILGTYTLFTTGSITILKILRGNKKYYYKTKHFTTVSGMIYRMKQNAIGLANICILSTMVLVSISTTVALYAGIEDIIANQYTSDIEVTIYQPEQEELQLVVDGIKDIAEKHSLEITNLNAYSGLSIVAKKNGDTFEIDYGYNMSGDELSVLFFITGQDYESITHSSVELSPEEVLVYGRDKPIGDYLEISNTRYMVKERLDTFTAQAEQASVVNVYCVVVSDRTELNKIFELQKDDYGTHNNEIDGYIEYDIEGTDEEVIAYFDDVKSMLNNAATDENGNGLSLAHGYGYRCRQAATDEIYGMYGGFLFLGIFLGSLFLMATILIIYYKQVTEGYSDRERFSIMQKVGMSRAEVKSTIKSQVLTVFFLPLAASCVHIAFAFSIIKRILFVFGLTNVALFAWCTIGTIAVFAVIYAIVYAVTARVYYKIVS